MTLKDVDDAMKGFYESSIKKQLEQSSQFFQNLQYAQGTQWVEFKGESIVANIPPNICCLNCGHTELLRHANSAAYTCQKCRSTFTEISLWQHAERTAPDPEVVIETALQLFTAILDTPAEKDGAVKVDEDVLGRIRDLKRQV